MLYSVHTHTHLHSCSAFRYITGNFVSHFVLFVFHSLTQTVSAFCHFILLHPSTSTTLFIFAICLHIFFLSLSFSLLTFKHELNIDNFIAQMAGCRRRKSLYKLSLAYSLVSNVNCIFHTHIFARFYRRKRRKIVFSQCLLTRQCH